MVSWKPKENEREPLDGRERIEIEKGREIEARESKKKEDIRVME
jgi:hypothetical protein